MSNSTLFISIAFLIVLSPIFSNRTKLPLAVVEILLGAIALWLGVLDSGNEVFKDLSKIGFFYLMFLAGQEIDLKRFKSQKEVIFKNAIVYFSTIYALSFGIYLIFDLNPVYIIAIPVVSLGMIMVLINEHGKEFE